MGKQLKITADTSPVKKSLLDLSRSVKNVGDSKVKIFSTEERKFLRTELNTELGKMKNKLKENKSAITEMVKEHQKLEKGTQAELKLHEKITKAMRTQAKLAKEATKLQQMKTAGGGGSIGGIGGMLKGLGGLAMGGAALLGGAALIRGKQASDQYRRGVGTRVRLQGLGVNDDSGVSPTMLANSGLTEQEFNQRRADAIGTLGRKGGNDNTILQQARMERGMGLEGGTFSNIAGSLRANFGGEGADDAQMKLQASILASGIEDAVAPYLEASTALLADINENGMTQTDQVVNMLGQLTKDGNRTPEQIAKTFQTINSSVKGSSGESNAFLQAAFAQAGIGNGTIGGTKLAISSGGIMGLSEEAMRKRGYSDSEISNMSELGMMSGAGERTGAIMDRFKRSAGMETGAEIASADKNQMVGLAQMGNSVFGTTGMQGYDALKMMEKVQKGEMSQDTFDSKMKDLKEGKDPMAEKIGTINDSLAGQTETLGKLNENLMEALGKNTVKVTNKLIDIENAVLMTMNPAVDGVVDNAGSSALVGAGAGAMTGAAIGSLVPVVGTILGGLIGAGVGGIGGYMMGGSDPTIAKQGNLPKGTNSLEDNKIIAKDTAALNATLKELDRTMKQTRNPSVNITNKNVNNNNVKFPAFVDKKTGNR